MGVAARCGRIVRLHDGRIASDQATRAAEPARVLA
jgi:hypothetical protein